VLVHTKRIKKTFLQRCCAVVYVVEQSFVHVVVAFQTYWAFTQYDLIGPTQATSDWSVRL